MKDNHNNFKIWNDPKLDASSNDSADNIAVQRQLDKSADIQQDNQHHAATYNSSKQDTTQTNSDTSYKITTKNQTDAPLLTHNTTDPVNEPRHNENYKKKARTHNKNITLNDVAKHAGVSKSTVSLVLQNSQAVHHKTRDRVIASIQATGYIYNRRAASLRQQKHRDSFAVLLHSLRSPYSSELLDEFERLSLERNLLPHFSSNVDQKDQQEKHVQLYLEHGVSGLIICPATQTDASWLEQLKARGLPMVQIMRRAPFSEIPSVTADNRNSTKEAVSHLIEYGHKKIAFIGGNAADSDFQERYNGYLDAHHSYGLNPDPNLCLPCVQGFDEGKAAGKAALAIEANLTAAFCFTDFIAYGVIEAANEQGHRVGENFAIVGFDDIVFSKAFHPPISSIQVDNAQMAKEAIRLLQETIAGRDLRDVHIKVDSKLIIRESSNGFRLNPNGA